MGEREIKSDTRNFPYRCTRHYPRRFDCVVWRAPGVPIWEPHGGAVASAAARLRVMPCVSFRCYCTLTRILYPGQLSPNAQGRTIPASNTQTHSHATHPLGAQSTSLRLRFSTPTQRFSRSNIPRRRRAPALQGHQHGAQKTLRREATGACGSTYRGR